MSGDTTSDASEMYDVVLQEQVRSSSNLDLRVSAHKWVSFESSSRNISMVVLTEWESAPVNAAIVLAVPHPQQLKWLNS
jgi:hypothetical protein